MERALIEPIAPLDRHDPKEFESEHYRFEDGVAVLEVAVRSIDQLFDLRDPAPFRERDLDENLVDQLISSLQELSPRARLAIRIFISEPVLDPNAADGVREAFRAHFAFEARLLAGRLKKHMRMGRRFLVVGVSTLVACLSFSEFAKSHLGESTFSTILAEGLVISGWVAMWRPIEVFLYDWWPIRERKRYFQRLQNVEIEILSAPAGRFSRGSHRF